VPAQAGTLLNRPESNQRMAIVPDRAAIRTFFMFT
jgi:hypothetical protein